MLEINWSIVPSDYRFAAMDYDGAVYLYTAKPNIKQDYGVWDFDYSGREYSDFLIATDLHNSYDWKYSLTERPE